MSRRPVPPAGVFAALGDPTRLAVLEAVAAEGPVTATELAADLPITRQAVAKHLGVLRDAGLVAGERSGRETRYEARPDGLEPASHWIAEAGAQWDRRLSRLRSQLATRRP